MAEHDAGTETDTGTDRGPLGVTLLRRLVGRVPDDYLQVFRGYLAASEWKLLADSLTGYLLREQVALTEPERRLLDKVVGPGVAAKLPDPATDPPAYRFTADGPDPGTGERWLAGVVPRMPTVRRLAAAYRRPADTAAIPLATWVFLVELDAGANVAHVQGQLRVGAKERGVVEVYAVGETLPPYHVEALRAAREVWSRDP